MIIPRYSCLSDIEKYFPLKKQVITNIYEKSVPYSFINLQGIYNCPDNYEININYFDKTIEYNQIIYSYVDAYVFDGEFYYPAINSVDGFNIIMINEDFKKAFNC